MNANWTKPRVASHVSDTCESALPRIFTPCTFLCWNSLKAFLIESNHDWVSAFSFNVQKQAAGHLEAEGERLVAGDHLEDLLGWGRLCLQPQGGAYLGRPPTGQAWPSPWRPAPRGNTPCQ